MDIQQEYHLSRIRQKFSDLVDKKYRKGAAEHGGHLLDYSPEQLLDFAIEEAIDQVTYLLSLKEKMERK